MLAADGAFFPDGRFIALPRVPGSLLAEGFRRAVLEFLVKNAALAEEIRSRMLAWRHRSFSAHNEVRVAAEDIEGRKKLAGTMLRAPMSLQKMKERSPPLDPASWPPYASLPLTDHPVPDIA